MEHVQKTDFAAYLSAAAAASGDSVYPLSVVSGMQTGAVFADDNAVLFHHFCGFAYCTGSPDVDTLYRFLTDERRGRFVLITADDNLIAALSAYPGLQTADRIYYTHDGRPFSVPALPEGFTLRCMDAALLQGLTGRIVPSFSWDSPERFLKYGFGYCVMHGDRIAASAFTAAVTAHAADIGIETAEQFRRMGLAKIAAGAVLRDILAQGNMPHWAHAASNTGSMKTAQALGFSETHRCKTIQKEVPCK